MKGFLTTTVMVSPMLDPHGRPVKGLRISLTERCNLRCDYCHREGSDTGAGVEMTPKEVGTIVRVGTGFGVRAVKLTGGEPLVRKDISDVVAAIRAVEGIRDISMTTNGVLLAAKATGLAAAGLDRVNVSLDTLDPALYREMTGVGTLDDVLEGLDAAIEHLSPVKLNFVLTNRNAHELDRLMDYARDSGAILQVIELVDTNLPCDAYGGAKFSAAPLEERLSREADMIIRRSLHARTKYKLSGGLTVEVVRSMHNSTFCANCSRLRLTANGHLKPCLMRKDNLFDILTPLRTDDIDACRKAFERAIVAREPYFR